jgi:ATP adenylyltransferase
LKAGASRLAGGETTLSLEQIWAPWRLAYIKGESESIADAEPAQAQWSPGADRACFICRGVADRAADADKRHLLIEQRPFTVVLLNRYPYNNGHLLVAPQKHVGQLDQLGPEVEAELHQTLTRMVTALARLMSPEGFNIGLNLGRVAGAGLPGHLHWHIVPRWSGDTNFMPILAGASVIPQSLEALWEALRDELAKTN